MKLEEMQKLCDGVLAERDVAMVERFKRYRGQGTVVVQAAEVGAICRRLSRLEAASTPGVLERYRAQQDEVLKLVDAKRSQAAKFGLGQQYDALDAILVEIREIFNK